MQLFPVVTYLSSACFWAISIQQVYKVTALMDFRKEVVFFCARVGGSSEASCLSSFNWFSVAIGAGRFPPPLLPWKCSTSERAAWIQIFTEVSGELSRILHSSSLTLDDLQLTVEEMFGSEGLYYSESDSWVHSNVDLRRSLRTAYMHCSTGSEDTSCVGKWKTISWPLFCQSGAFISFLFF